MTESIIYQVKFSRIQSIIHDSSKTYIYRITNGIKSDVDSTFELYVTQRGQKLTYEFVLNNHPNKSPVRLRVLKGTTDYSIFETPFENCAFWINDTLEEHKSFLLYCFERILNELIT